MRIKTTYVSETKIKIENGKWVDGQSKDRFEKELPQAFGMDLVVSSYVPENEMVIVNRGWRPSEDETLVISPSALNYLRGL